MELSYYSFLVFFDNLKQNDGMKKKNSLNLIRRFSFALLWMISLCAVAQNITVSGTVYDINGEPLLGVTILVQGTSVGTVTLIRTG